MSVEAKPIPDPLRKIAIELRQAITPGDPSPSRAARELTSNTYNNSPEYPVYSRMDWFGFRLAREE